MSQPFVPYIASNANQYYHFRAKEDNISELGFFWLLTWLGFKLNMSRTTEQPGEANVNAVIWYHSE